MAGSRLHSICGADTIQEGFFCNYEVNPEYVPKFEAGGLRFTAFGAGGQARALELEGHPFFIATLFHPQLGSRPGAPHPLIVAYVNAARAIQ